jgi:uncharacterized protein YlxP (DUF503 family)
VSYDTDTDTDTDTNTDTDTDTDANKSTIRITMTIIGSLWVEEKRHLMDSTLKTMQEKFSITEKDFEDLLFRRKANIQYSSQNDASLNKVLNLIDPADKGKMRNSEKVEKRRRDSREKLYLLLYYLNSIIQHFLFVTFFPFLLLFLFFPFLFNTDWKLIKSEDGYSVFRKFFGMGPSSQYACVMCHGVINAPAKDVLALFEDNTRYVVLYDVIWCGVVCCTVMYCSEDSTYFVIFQLNLSCFLLIFILIILQA